MKNFRQTRAGRVFYLLFLDADANLRFKIWFGIIGGSVFAVIGVVQVAQDRGELWWMIVFGVGVLILSIALLRLDRLVSKTEKHRD